MSPELDSLLDGRRGYKDTGKKGRVSVKTDEVVIRCDYAKVEAASNGAESVEADDLIWWSWDEKMVGFCDL